MDLIKLYNSISKLPLGKKIFTFMICWRAPYFSSITPLITELTPETLQVAVKLRRNVKNHLGTMHAIAMCNACELAAGVFLEANLPKAKRWIPKAMQVEYLQKATTDITAAVAYSAWHNLPTGDFILPVLVSDTRGNIVMRATITMWISDRGAIK